MYIECLSKLDKTKLNIWESFIMSASLTPDLSIDKTVLIWDSDTLIAAGSRRDNLLKCIATAKERQGEGLTAKLITTLRQDAFSDGINHLFLYTKPENEEIFSSLFFYPVAKTGSVLLMENKKDGIKKFLDSLEKSDVSDNVGSVVMNCNPFTLGHQYLIETAAKECDHLYVFAVSEDKSDFSYNDRFEMMLRGTAHLKNVTVLPTGPYLISSATFPDYFLKERDKLEEIHCLLDIEIFTKYYTPKFSITKRYVGTEPLSCATDLYNKALKRHLPDKSIEVVELPRLELLGAPISASRARSLIKEGDKECLKTLVPTTTFDYLNDKNLI